ncbi:MAG: hypothetical protein JXR25_01830, partial [Pontiellaceae bacterium]|nr:hypothetical protein [Pontiellaceae bacterium]MBN2783538.1 hypothetical protein [Pontiellaceae bacterium]
PDAFKVDGVRLRIRAYTYYYDRATEFYVDRLAIGEVTPGAPVPLSPTDGSVVQILNPTLTVENAIDILDDNCSYEFEIYTNADLSAESLVRYLPVQAAGDGSTSWQVDVDMIDGLQYWWRSRATSSSGHLSAWSATNTFHVVIVNNPPSDPFILSPYANATLPDEHGYFIWFGSRDPDATDYIAEYRLEVAEDEAFSSIVMSAVETNYNLICAKAFNSFSGYESIPTNQVYFWRVCAVDSQGLSSDWIAESFIYGSLNDIVVIDPVTITDMVFEDGLLKLSWTPSDYAAQIEFTPTLSPADWQPVDQAWNIQTNYYELAAPTNSNQGFFRVIIGD